MAARSPRPVVGLTPDLGESAPRPGRPALPRYELKTAYADAVLRAGGLPLVLPFADGEAAAELLARCDALVVTGGAFDIPPEAYGAAPHAKLGPVKPARTGFEQRLLRLALARDLPVLGVCGGMQLLAVELGGTLVQDIPSELPGALAHEQAGDPRGPAHAVRVVPGSLLARAAGALELQVNSTHHQAVRTAGKGRVSGVAPDGVVEGIEGEGRFVLGVQWHPELMGEEGVYRALVEAAR